MLCPYCNEESFAKKKLLRDGWKIIGEVEVCALCGRELPGKEKKDNTAAGADDTRRRNLAALLGGDVQEKVRLSGVAENDFCRNCRHFIAHPFRTVCALTDQDADPMGSCVSFSGRD